MIGCPSLIWVFKHMLWGVASVQKMSDTFLANMHLACDSVVLITAAIRCRKGCSIVTQIEKEL